MTALAIGLLGTGQVGKALLRRLGAAANGFAIAGLANSRESWSDPAGVAPESALARLATGSDLDRVVDALESASQRHRVLIDATPAAAVAARHAEWLARGIHVVSANKLALGAKLGDWRAVRDAQRRGNARYGCSATVGAGLPALASLARLVAVGDRPRTIEGVLSGTLSFLLNAYDGARPFSVLLAEARERGYCEPDPRADLSGRDVARKILILGRRAGFELEEHEVDVEPLLPHALESCSLEEFDARLPELDAWIEAQRAAAAGNGRVLRYLAHLDSSGRASVRLQALPPTHPCAQLRGTDNLFAFTTERYREQPLVIQGPGAGPEVTAQALLADALEIAAA